MPRGPAPAWRARKPPVLDDYVLASVTQAGGLGRHHPETGHYAELVIRGLSKEDAAEYRRALYRCAHYLSRNGLAPVGMSAGPPQRDGSQWKITFRAVDKTLARKHVLERYGPDRSKWPYDPRRRNE